MKLERISRLPNLFHDQEEYEDPQKRLLEEIVDLLHDDFFEKLISFAIFSVCFMNNFLLVVNFREEGRAVQVSETKKPS